MENPIKMDDLGVPPFTETPMCWNGTLYIKLHPSKTICTLHLGKKKKHMERNNGGLEDDFH